jgi:hypothetical protein
MSMAAKFQNNITSGQIKIIHTLARELDLVDKAATEQGNMDALHSMVYSMTGKESIKALTVDEAGQIIDRLKGNMRGFRGSPPPVPRSPGMITEGEKKKIWALMYELKKHDACSTDSSLAKRLCKIIKLYTGIDAHPNDPFKFLSHDKANSVIETIKGIVRSQKKNVERR